MARKKGSKDYPIELKREAIRLFFEEGWPQAEITAHLSIRDPKRVKNWLWQFRKRGEAMFQPGRRGRRPTGQDQTAYIAQLEMENELLKKFHTELRAVLRERRNSGVSKRNEDDTP